MIIIGELINATRKEVAQAIQKRDVYFFQDLARRQVEAGADVIDINVAIGKDESACMKWLVDAVQDVIDKPLCIDTTDPAVLEAGLQSCKNPPWINSISGENGRIEAFLPLAKKYDFSNIIALIADDNGSPQSLDERLKVCQAILRKLGTKIDTEKIFFDPLIFPIGTDKDTGHMFLETIHMLKSHDYNIVGAVSNISFGLPKRQILNQVFVVMVTLSKIDAAIINPLNFNLMTSIKATNLLLGNDHRCRKYTKYIRKHSSHQ